MNVICPLLSEVLRPQHLSDLTLPQHDINRLQNMVDSSSVMNMLFYGAPGLGKTSAARLIKNIVASESGIEHNGSKVIWEHIEGYATSMSLCGGRKLCLIDEADCLPKKIQDALRPLIERISHHCRFILTANDHSNLTPGLRSRLLMIKFDIEPGDRHKVKDRLISRYEAKLTELGIAYDGNRLREIVGIYYPDFRSIANRLEYEFALSISGADAVKVQRADSK